MRSPSTVRVHLSGIKFFFEITLKREWGVFHLVRPQKRTKFPVVLSSEETKHLLSLVRMPKSRMALTMIYACGLRLGVNRGQVNRGQIFNLYISKYLKINGDVSN